MHVSGVLLDRGIVRAVVEAEQTLQGKNIFPAALCLVLALKPDPARVLADANTRNAPTSAAVILTAISFILVCVEFPIDCKAP